MSTFKKIKYEVGDLIEFNKSRKIRRGMIIKKKAVKGGHTFIVSTQDGGLVGPVYVKEITGAVHSAEREDDVAKR